MIRETLTKDRVMDFLLKNSNITEAQLDTYLITLSKKSKNITLTSMTELRNRKVTKGSFIRTLRQGQRNLTRSLYTTILAEYTGLVESGGTTKVVQIGAMLHKIRWTDAKDQDSSTVIQQISQAVTYLVESQLQ